MLRFSFLNVLKCWDFFLNPLHLLKLVSRDFIWKLLEGFDLVLNNILKQPHSLPTFDFCEKFQRMNKCEIIFSNNICGFLRQYWIDLKSICLSVCNLVTIQISPQTPISMENICHFLQKTDPDDDGDNSDKMCLECWFCIGGINVKLKMTRERKWVCRKYRSALKWWPRIFTNTEKHKENKK